MSELELSQILKGMYRNAPEGDSVAMIHLFGIKFSEQLKCKNISISNVVLLSQIPVSYKAEVAKGIRLSKYVLIK